MGRPSIFSSDYQKFRRKRRIISYIFILLTALIVIFIANSKSAVPLIKKLISSININTNININKIDIGKDKNKDIVNSSQEIKKNEVIKEQAKPENQTGEYLFKFTNGENLSLIYNKTNSKFIDIKTENKNITFDIRDDGKSIVFDNPTISDIWIFNIDGTSKKISLEYYKKSGEEELFKKEDTMKQYNDYVWAAKPKFLKDGRIVYQSFLPWFKNINTYYLWIVNSDGQGSRMLLNTNKNEPAKYFGFSQDNKLIVEIGGIKYMLNADERSIQEIN